MALWYAPAEPRRDALPSWLDCLVGAGGFAQGHAGTSIRALPSQSVEKMCRASERDVAGAGEGALVDSAEAEGDAMPGREDADGALRAAELAAEGGHAGVVAGELAEERDLVRGPARAPTAVEQPPELSKDVGWGIAV